MNLTTIFGDDARGRDAKAAARTSKRRFVRSQRQLAPYEPSRRPTGHVLTAWEAFSAFGIDVLEEAIEYGAATLKCERNASGNALRRRREELNLSPRDVGRAASLSQAQMKSAEVAPSTLRTIELENAAFVLGLDERLLAFKADAGGDEHLAYRLRTLSDERGQSPRILTPRTALVFAETASIIRVQLRLQRWLGIKNESGLFAPTDYYGGPENPAWKVGYNLATEAREKLRLGVSPVDSMRTLVEERLGIPVVQAELGQNIAGATVVTVDEDGEEARGVVLNTAGQNENVWVRRTTLAHELGHLLFDPNDELKHVRVDPYSTTQADPETHEVDYVEQRANAFAIYFLAPPDEVRKMATFPFSEESVANVMHTFGISRTAASYHICNVHHRQYGAPEFGLHEEPGDGMKAAENFTIDFFPIEDTFVQRRGRFAALVVRAFDEGLITADTASLYLQCSVETFRDQADLLREIFGE